ncbi:hypothetical protein FB45DRAFT_928873 [Roridomyces roridus]|uniref:Uncharacterized protein n=1 Tax=Roridomyces roridus TaxID=1738132 RepID=A0AAD7FFL8_9AGAR|nr:hypothetical protein FB45DRAFT_928873 [Roridomyces roridus]
MSLAVASFPEELLESILFDAVVGPSYPHARTPWHRDHHSHGAHTTPTRTRLAPLLVCRAFHRIGLPLFYDTLVLHTPSQSANCLRALRAQPHLARAVRTLVLPAPSSADAQVLALLRCGLRALDITLPSSTPDGLPEALRQLRGLHSISIRKSSGTYLSTPHARVVLGAISEAVAASPALTSASTSFPLSSDPALVPLVAALASAPRLTSLLTPVPTFWGPALPTIAANPALTRISLGDEPQGHHRRPVLGTSLFLAEARKHPRLADLIRAGTAVVGWRGRAWTMPSGPPALSDQQQQEGRC